jgi:hypothetical protein
MRVIAGAIFMLAFLIGAGFVPVSPPFVVVIMFLLGIEALITVEKEEENQKLRRKLREQNKL